jgi:hypothetical protein
MVDGRRSLACASLYKLELRAVTSRAAADGLECVCDKSP